MNKHNSKAVAILACLLSSCSIASAHPAQKILGNESNLKQSKSDNSSNGGLTTILTSIALLGAAGGLGLGLEAYYCGAFSDPSEDNESKKFLASSSTSSSSSSDVQIPEFYDENGERIYLYKAAQLEQNPVAKQIVYNMIYNEQVKNGLAYWQETYFKNAVLYFGLVGIKLENVDFNDNIHLKLYVGWDRDILEFFDSKEPGNMHEQLSKNVLNWRKIPGLKRSDSLLRKIAEANRNKINAVVQPKLENKADNVMFSKPVENVTPMATESNENEDSYVSQNYSPAPFDSTDVGMTPETDQGTDGTMYTKPASNGIPVENKANENEERFSIFNNSDKD